MDTILWQSERGTLFQSFQDGGLPDHARGADAYEYEAARLLSQSWSVAFDPAAVRPADLGSARYWKQLRSSRLRARVCVKSVSVIVHGRMRRDSVNVGMLHHIYLGQKHSSLKGRLSVRVLLHNLRKLDVVVVCSKVWQDFVKNTGCRNVEIIYNAFDPAEFAVTRPEVEQFLAAHGLPSDKPIVYVGYAEPVKGVVETCDALKSAGYTLVMTGGSGDLGLPVRHFRLSRPDYIRLLTACDVVINMSTIEEGWSRIAHEAMLCRTPVIGSGTGGMKELLDGGGQEICETFEDLPAMAAHVISHADEYAPRGYAYASQFTLELFEKRWTEVIRAAMQATLHR